MSRSSRAKDLRIVSRGFRWGHRPLAPGSVPLPQLAPREYPTAWARSPLGRAARAGIQAGLLKPLIDSQVSPSVEGLDVLSSLAPPVIFFANHSSHLDAPLILTSLPPAWRERTAVGAAADYFFDVWWRAAATALAIGAFPVERAGANKTTGLARRMLADRWNVVVFPEGTRSKDGTMRAFRSGAARLCVEEGVPAVPIALRGTYQAMPRGRGWPAPGRKPVHVRFGDPVVPLDGEDPRVFADRMRSALTTLLAEDRGTWWEALKSSERPALPAGASAGPSVALPSAKWRRVWDASEPLPARRSAWK